MSLFGVASTRSLSSSSRPRPGDSPQTNQQIQDATADRPKPPGQTDSSLQTDGIRSANRMIAQTSSIVGAAASRGRHVSSNVMRRMFEGAERVKRSNYLRRQPLPTLRP